MPRQTEPSASNGLRGCFADADTNRAPLDRRVVGDLLGFGEAACWGSTSRPTWACGGWRPSGALSRRCTGGRRGRGRRGQWWV